MRRSLCGKEGFGKRTIGSCASFASPANSVHMVDISVQNAFVVFESAHDASASETALSPVVLTVEHASSRIPPDWPSPSPSDAELLKKHWGIDIGAENLARELAAAISTANLANRGRQIVRGVAARFSRLLCDANRNLEEDEGVESDYRNGKRGDGGTMMRRTCEDGKVVVDMNAVS